MTKDKKNKLKEYQRKYQAAKTSKNQEVKTLTGVANTIFWSNKIQKKKNTLHLHCSNIY